MVRQKSIVKDYSAIYSLLKIEDTPLLITFFRDSNSVDLQIMFFTYDLNRKIRDYSITLSAFPKSDKLYLVYAIDNHLLHNIFNKVMCKYLIYYMFLETDKARQLIDQVLEDYKNE
jgi:hypothetical protein